MVKYGVLRGFYELERTIGCGGFAKVKLATHLATGEKVAIKIMEKTALKDDLPRVKLELKALKSLSHPHICKLYQVIETDTHFFLVVEYCSGGELFDHIVEKNRLSETESRTFFRQIVSAVAYLHFLGYAHRDLKPENILLDYAQNLKLIDFGLCARPEGGMQNPLFTSCGSPTYAAPELVLGRQYLGQEVDVWAMGVLLYALMAGFLPFDDQNIDSLYKKILSGRYDEPYFMSNASRRIIREMLQVDPKKRITITQLLSHPWLCTGGLSPIEIKTDTSRPCDDDIITLMAQYHIAPRDDMWKHLKRWKYDYDTATYLLLIARKRRGLPLKLMPGATRLPIRIRSAETIGLPKTATIDRKKLHRLHVLDDEGRLRSPSAPLMVTPNKLARLDLAEVVTPKTVAAMHEALSPDNFLEPRKPSSIRKPLKRIRSPNLDGDCSPVPSKKTPGRSTPKTPDERRGGVLNSGDGVSARKVLGSIERSLHKVRHVLTPRKNNAENNGSMEPIVLSNKDLCNVSTTQCTDPEFVVTELLKTLQRTGIHCERKGFAIRGKMEPNAIQRQRGCSFELEICYLPILGAITPSRSGHTSATLPPNRKLGDVTTPTGHHRGGGVLKKTTSSGDFVVVDGVELMQQVNRVGIRRKRLKGDSWCYKKVCEQVLALTATELKQTTTTAIINTTAAAAAATESQV